MTSHDIEKALEVWGLQNLLDISIMLGILAFGLAIIQPYYESLKRHLTLRVSLELWDLFTTLAIDVLLAIVVISGYIVLNPDIMADIKMAVPFIPIATVLFTVALFLRILHGGHSIKNLNFRRSLWLMFYANLINVIGFTFVMEAPSSEYLAIHPSPFWTFVKNNLRSNADPHGLELSQLTFYICFAALVVVFIWGFKSAMKHIRV